MFSPESKNLLEAFASIYKKTGKNEFNVEDYASIPDHDAAISELIGKGILEQANDILATLSINPDLLKD